MITKLGLPYMGSKRKLASKIINKIMADNPNTKYIYDLFGGGGAISLYAIQVPKIEKVFYNELNHGVVELFKDVLDNGVTSKYYQWVNSETFHKHKNDNDWFGGLCKVVWSFGNNQRSYLFGKTIEADKKLLHEIVVDKNRKSLSLFNEKFDVNVGLNEDLFELTINERRLNIQRQLKKHLNNNNREKLSKIMILGGENPRNITQQLQQVQQLEKIGRLTTTSKLSLTCKSYNEVDILTPTEETIIYLDPPYKNTGKYQKTIDYDNLLKWIKKSKYKVYVSSYEFDDLECVAEFEHRATMSATANNKVSEKLFYWQGCK